MPRLEGLQKLAAVINMSLYIFFPHKLHEVRGSSHVVFFLLLIQSLQIISEMLSSSVLTYFITLVSSANILRVLIRLHSDILSIIIMKRSGPRTVPCGTPRLTSETSEITLLAITYRFLSLWKLWSYNSSFPLIPFSPIILHNIPLSTLSNSLAKFKYTVSTFMQPSRPLSISS